jgi:hypothetical protein
VHSTREYEQITLAVDSHTSHDFVVY